MSSRIPLVMDEREISVAVCAVSTELCDLSYKFRKPLKFLGHLRGFGLVELVVNAVRKEYTFTGFGGLWLISHLIINTMNGDSPRESAMA